MTTMGRTTRCSANRPMAAGSASRTLVSRTYVRRRALAAPGVPGSVRVLLCRAERRAEELATRSPLGAQVGTAFGHRSVGETGTGPRRAGRRPFARLACVLRQQARGCRGPSRRAATHRPSSSDGTWGWPVPEVPAPRFTAAPGARVVRSRTAGDAPHTSARRAGNRPAGRRASKRRRSRTLSARSATAGTRPAAAPPRS